MRTYLFAGRYRVDTHGFLLDSHNWDEQFAEASAPEVDIPGGLTDAHWKILYFLRHTFDKMTACPLLYIACQRNDLGLGDIKTLFPAGYLRGACRLAGITYREAKVQQTWIEEHRLHFTRLYENRKYPQDGQGYLADPAGWDEHFAVKTALRLKRPALLTDRHWQIIYLLRRVAADTGQAPTPQKVCEMLDLSPESLAELFPDDLGRHAAMIAGLRDGHPQLSAAPDDSPSRR